MFKLYWSVVLIGIILAHFYHKRFGSNFVTANEDPGVTPSLTTFSQSELEKFTDPDAEDEVNRDALAKAASSPVANGSAEPGSTQSSLTIRTSTVKETTRNVPSKTNIGDSAKGAASSQGPSSSSASVAVTSKGPDLGTSSKKGPSVDPKSVTEKAERKVTKKGISQETTTKATLVIIETKATTKRVSPGKSKGDDSAKKGQQSKTVAATVTAKSAPPVTTTSKVVVTTTTALTTLKPESETVRINVTKALSTSTQSIIEESSESNESTAEESTTSEVVSGLPESGTYIINNDLPDLIDHARIAFIKLKYFLKEQRDKHPHFTNDFSEYGEFFYLILMPLMTHAKSNYQCMSRRSTLYEIANLRQLTALSKIKNSDGILLRAIVPPSAELKIWLDIEIDIDGKINYPSGEPLLEFMGVGKDHAKVPVLLPTGHCVYFDFKKFNYGNMLCTEKAVTICYIKKTAQLMRDRLFWETINDKISELSNLEIHPRTKFTYRDKLEQFRSGNCSSQDSKIYSLTENMALQQPSRSLARRLYLDRDVYFTLYPGFIQDMEVLKRVVYSQNFESDLKMALNLPTNIKMVYNKLSDLFCVDADRIIIPKNHTRAGHNTTLNDTAGERDILKEIASYTIIELVLALCAAITTVIAVINSICIAIVSGRKVDKAAPAFVDELEMTPLTARKVQFGSDQISQYDPYSSADTFPSPEPVSRRNYRN